MEVSMKDITDRFQICAENGTIYDAVELQDRIFTTSLDDTHQQTVRGLKSYKRIDGCPLNRIDDDTFEIVWTGEHAKRVW